MLTIMATSVSAATAIASSSAPAPAPATPAPLGCIVTCIAADMSTLVVDNVVLTLMS